MNEIKTNTTPFLEIKDFGGTGFIKDLDLKRNIVTGYLSGYAEEDGKPDYDKDIILFGAGKKTLNERKSEIYFLNQHEWKQPHGFFNVLEEHKQGVYFESNPLIDTTYSSDAIKLYEAGIIKEHSIGYQTLNSKNRDDGVRIITEYKLYEGSNVTLGANPNTPFTGFKSLTLQEVNDRAKAILKAFRNGTFTDETFVLLEYALKELQSQAYILGTKSQVIIEPLENTQKDNFADIITNYSKTI